MQHHPDLLVRRRGEHRHPRHLGEQGQVEDAVVRRTVGAGDAGPVEAVDVRQFVEADVEVGLVERPAEERGVHGDDGPQPTHRHARGRGDRMLLGDADVEDAVGEALLEGQEAGGARHGRGDRHQLGSGLGLLDDRLGERGGVARLGRLARRLRADLGVEAAGVVQALLLVLLGRRVALALGGEDVDDDRAVELGGVAQRLLHDRDVVAVEGAAVANAEGLEEDRRLEHLAEAGPSPRQPPGEVLADHRHLADDLLGPAAAAHVAGVEAEPRHAGGEAADGRCVGAAVVVEDDDGLAAGVAEVVERLVGHAAGEGAVADHRDGLAAATGSVVPGAAA